MSLSLAEKAKRLSIYAIAAVLLLVGLVKSLEQARAERPLIRGALAPAGVVRRLADGAPVDLASFRGKILLVDFWATWCPPCVAEMPSLDRIARKYRDQGVEVLALNGEDAAPDIQAFLSEHRLNLPVALADETVMGPFKVRALPTTYLIDRSGRVLFGRTGLTSESDIAEAIEEALKASPSSGG